MPVLLGMGETVSEALVVNVTDLLQVSVLLDACIGG